MNNSIRRAAVIVMLLIALAVIAAPVTAAKFYQGGLNTQSYPSFTKVNPISISSFTSSPPQYLDGKYANLNNYLSAGALTVNTGPITVPSMATSNSDWDTLFSAPAYSYSCGCG
jgi:hypothetical protein